MLLMKLLYTDLMICIVCIVAMKMADEIWGKETLSGVLAYVTLVLAFVGVVLTILGVWGVIK